ncbi:hypothetical protein [Sphingomonas gilva]|nr:hypothetical protein [Sphingomonas gilva]
MEIGAILGLVVLLGGLAMMGVARKRRPQRRASLTRYDVNSFGKPPE